MIKGCRNFYWVVLLAVLQCFAPLLHAHVTGHSQSSGIHFHADDDMLEHVGTLAGMPEFKAAKTEYPAIGVAQEYKKDYAFLVVSDDVPFLSPYRLAVARRMSPDFVWPACEFFDGISCSPPPSRAPPVFFPLSFS